MEGFRTGVYHAGLSDSVRHSIHMEFLRDKLDVVRLSYHSTPRVFCLICEYPLTCCCVRTAHACHMNEFSAVACSTVGACLRGLAVFD